MYAVIETGGKQYRVSQGDVIRVEKLKVETGNRMEFDKVLVVGSGSSVQVGAPYLDAAKVVGSVVEHGKGEKVIIFKYKAKKDYRKKRGHRQPYTMVQIDVISADGSVPKAPVKKEAAVKEVSESADVAKQADEPVVAKKPAAKKATAKADTPDAEKKPARKPAAKKAEADADKPVAEKKPRAKKSVAKEETVEKTEE